MHSIGDVACFGRAKDFRVLHRLAAVQQRMQEHRADKALYRAKGNGRNRVERAG